MVNSKNLRRVVGAFVLSVLILFGSLAASSHEPRSEVSASAAGADDSQWG